MQLDFKRFLNFAAKVTIAHVVSYFVVGAAAYQLLTKQFYEGSATVPFLTVGATDARFFRRAGATSYGFGLFSTALSMEDYGVMFHGDNERVDVESLRLSTEMWEAVARDLLG